MSDIEFVNPSWLWALFLLIPAALIIYSLENLRIKRTLLVSNPNSRVRAVFNLFSMLPIVILTLLIFALARPYIGSTTVELPGTSKDILILQDVSKSMLATDIKPSRLEFAKRKFRDIVKYSSGKLTKSRIGIVLFSGESYLYCPLTEDYAVLEYFIKSISSDLITSQGTAISDAVTTAIESLREVKAKDPVVILITDGEDNQLEASSVIEAANKAGIKINVLAVGTKEGSPIPESYGGFLKDKDGNIVISKLAEVNLRDIAKKTGGTFQYAGVTNTDIANIFPSKTDGGVSELSKKNFIIYNEKAHYLLAAALIISLLFSVIGKESAIFILLFMLIMQQTANADEGSKISLNESYHAYKNGDYEKAGKAFSYYHEKYPDDLKIAQSYASTLYKQNKFEEANKIFEKIYSLSQNGKQKFEAKYNAANSKFMLQDFNNSIKDYEAALNIKPGDENTLNNLQLARQKLDELKSKPTPTPTPTPSPVPSQNKQENQNKEENQQQQKSEEEKKGEEKEQERQNEQEGDKKDSPDKEGDNKNKGDEKPDDAGGNKDDKEEQQAGPTEHDEKEMKETEAKAWLESLADSPVLLRRKVSRTTNRNNQQW